ncbi:hypothetical protein LSM04_004111 [Trypanosoma melophagium]|uniref:uncharacterized protein n=1 Tax=Trypanosoma melophagium TaxID=715481 RepID=UPI00351A4B60|nr:hypothetical protein LSM04_004111 [Trypanosoma melophagium]
MIPFKVKHFEEGSWTDKRSTTTTSSSSAATVSAKSVSVCISDLGSSPSTVVDMDSFSEVLLASSPSFIFVHNATMATRQQMMQLLHVRKLYSITDLVRYEPREGPDKGTVVLLRVGANCDAADNATKVLASGMSGNGVVRLFTTLQICSFAGVSLTLAVLYIDTTAVLWQRVNAFNEVLPHLGNSDTLVLCSNLLVGCTESTGSEMHAMCTGKGFVDAAEEAGEKHSNNGSTHEWSLWVKASKLSVTHFTHELSPSFAASGHFAKGFPPVTTVTLGPRSATTITIPQPRSAKSGNPRGSPSTTATATTPTMITDPAILSAEAAGKVSGGTTKGPGSAIIERLLQQQQQQQHQSSPRWMISHSYTLKSNEKLNSHESAFDISAHFATLSDAVEALNNKSIYWPADFCVVHGVVLVSDNIGQCDRRVMFRRYAREYKNSYSLIAQMFSYHGNNTTTSMNTAANTNNSNNNSSMAATSEKTSWLKRVAALSCHTSGDVSTENGSIIPVSRALRREEELRTRTWDISWCTIVYQVTPREMKFNITPLVGHGRDNLTDAIRWLNIRSQPNSVVTAAHVKENPLQNYVYDYALLFSVELQGYWLIAATHVPCDIVACRAAA